MKRILLIIALLCPLMIVYAQKEDLRSIQRNLDDYNDYFQPEYVELNFDKDFYFSGENIWYSLHLTDQAYLSSSTSAVVYVDVRDKRDSVLIRQKVRCKQGLAHGEIALPKQFPTGYYKIVPFTLWMLNTGNYKASEKRIPIIHPANFSLKEEQRREEHKAQLLTINKTAPNSFTLNITAGTQGQLIAYNREEVRLNQKADPSVTVSLNFDKPGDRYVYVVLADDYGNILEKHVLANSNMRAEAFISMFGREEFSPGDQAEFSIDIKDKMGRPLAGNVSISIRPRDQVLDAVPVLEGEFSNYPTKTIENRPLRYDKEVFIYPPVKGSLPSIDFSVSVGAVPYTFPEASKSAIVSADVMKKIAQGYGQEVFYDTETGYNLPINIAYKPSDYAPLPSVEDFIREVVATVKVRKVKGQNEIFVRNSDTQSNIFFYKKPALVLIDGNVAKSADEMLNTPLSDIDKIEVLWETAKINSLSVFSYADQGIVSVTTKSKSAVMSGHDRLLGDFHQPLVFSNFKPSPNEQAVPVLMDPVYWNPEVKVDGKKRIAFRIPDDLGELTIMVKGFTEIGDYVTAEAKISVKLTAAK